MYAHRVAYAVFTRVRGHLDPVALRAAFDATPLLTAIDAQRALRVNRAGASTIPGGVITVGLEAPVARQLAEALTERGIVADAVDEAWLALPNPQTCRKYELTATEVIFELYDGPVHVPYQRIACVACGVLPTEKLVTADTPKPRFHLQSSAKLIAPPTTSGRKRVRSSELMVDIVMADPPRRIRLRSERLDLPSDGKDTAYRGGPQLSGHLSQLVTDLAKRADTAALSLGAERVVEEGKVHRYHSHTEYNKELAWLLWRYAGPAVGGRDQPFSSLRPRADLVSREYHARMEELDAHLRKSEKIDLLISGATGIGGGLMITALRFAELNALAISIFLLAGFLISWGVYATIRENRKRWFLEP